MLFRARRSIFGSLMIAENIADIRDRVDRRCRAIGRDPAGVRIIAVSKTFPAASVREAVRAGLCDIGENYVQELLAKHRELEAGPVRWHMIGHLQTNKAKKAVRVFDMIETVDSMKLAREIDKACEVFGREVMEVLIEINSAEEPQKAGVMPEDAAQLIREMAHLTHVRVKGLMTMGPFAGDPEEIRPYYRKTKALFDGIRSMEIPGVNMAHLSMGMSDSYRVALEEGANMVRIGTGIFGERKGTR